ncbi:MAG: ABC transporter substrate-binding protein [Deltaproteobacteria bacterium]|nr:ABC transporter substrate-binding protein [Deltaproteobacteria bacterium]
MKNMNINRRDFLVKSAAGAAGLLATPYLGLNVWAEEKHSPVRIAVEFNSHAVPAYVAIDKGLYEEEGLKFTAYKSYATGASLAAGLIRGDIDAAYVCLIPAVNTFSNAGVPIKVVCGTHLYGYGLAVNPELIRSVKDLEKPKIRVGGLREGTSVDTIIHKTMENFSLNKKAVMSKIRRMSPPKTIFAVRAGQLDAVFLPEHWLTMTEQYGFRVMLTARDLWPNMIGSVLAVKDELIQKNRSIVSGLVRATLRATEWMSRYPEKSAELAAKYLSFEGEKAPLAEAFEKKGELRVSGKYVMRSMKNLDYINSIDTGGVQQTIDYAASLGNIRESFDALKMLDLQFLKQG